MVLDLKIKGFFFESKLLGIWYIGLFNNIFLCVFLVLYVVGSVKFVVCL